MRTRKQSIADIYHVMARGSGRQIIFEDNEDRLYFLNLLNKTLHENSVVVLAWCLMDNHYHLLLQAPLSSISASLRSINAGYATRFNQRHGRTGHLFQGRFKSEPVNDDAYLMTVVRYIHRNPEGAGYAQWTSYRWSSYGEYTGEERLCKTAFVLGVFGGIEMLEDYHRASETEEGGKCLDIDSLRPRQSPSSEQLIERASKTLPDIHPADLKALPRRHRNDALRKLKQEGFSIREIERLTGVGRGIIHRA